MFWSTQPLPHEENLFRPISSNRNVSLVFEQKMIFFLDIRPFEQSTVVRSRWGALPAICQHQHRLRGERKDNFVVKAMNYDDIGMVRSIFELRSLQSKSNIWCQNCSTFQVLCVFRICAFGWISLFNTVRWVQISWERESKSFSSQGSIVKVAKPRLKYCPVTGRKLSSTVWLQSTKLYAHSATP